VTALRFDWAQDQNLPRSVNDAMRRLARVFNAALATVDFAAHVAATTSVHGITDTAQLPYKNAPNTFTQTQTATRWVSTIATGTAPLGVTSTTRVDNLTAHYLGAAAQDSAYHLARANHTGTQALATITESADVALYSVIESSLGVSIPSENISLGFANRVLVESGGLGSIQGIAFGAAGTVFKGTGVASSPAFAQIFDADVAAAASIAVSKLAAGSAGQVLRNNATPAPAWSTYTIADTFAKGTFPIASAANTLTAQAHPGAGNQVFTTTGADTVGWATSIAAAALPTGGNVSWVLGATTRVLDIDGIFKAPKRVNVGSQTNNDVLVVGDQSVSAGHALGSGVGIDLYADFNALASAFNFANRSTGTSAGVSMQFLLSDTAASAIRAGSMRFFKTGAWTAGAAATQSTIWTLRVLVAGVDTEVLRYTAGTGLNVVAGDLSIANALDHNGTTVGFYGVTPALRPSAYTQTYSTATRTHSAKVGLALTGIATSTTGTALAEPGAAYAQATMQQNFRRIQDQHNNVVTDVANIAQVLNQVIDDLQLNGLLQ
jgi:hypothetical protein